MSLIKGKSYICNECAQAAGNGCVLYSVGNPIIPVQCPYDPTLTAKFRDQTDFVKKKLKI